MPRPSDPERWFFTDDADPLKQVARLHGSFWEKLIRCSPCLGCLVAEQHLKFIAERIMDRHHVSAGKSLYQYLHQRYVPAGMSLMDSLHHFVADTHEVAAFSSQLHVGRDLKAIENQYKLGAEVANAFAHFNGYEHWVGEECLMRSDVLLWKEKKNEGEDIIGERIDSVKALAAKTGVVSEDRLREGLAKESFPDGGMYRRLHAAKEEVMGLLKGVEGEVGERGLLVREMVKLVEGLDARMEGTEAWLKQRADKVQSV